MGEFDLKGTETSAATDSSTSATSWSVSAPESARKGSQSQTLTIAHSNWLYHFDIPQNLYLLASQIKTNYLQSIPDDAQLPESLFESIFSFIDFITQGILDGSYGSTSNHQRLLRVILAHIDQEYVVDDIHAAASAASADAHIQARLIKKYYDACHVAHHFISSRKSALLESTRSGKSKIFAILGGQGITTQYFEELRLVYEVYGKYISDYLESLSKTLVSLVSKSCLKGYYPEGLDFMNWLSSGMSLNVEYLNSAPVSFPLIGVLQLSHYYVCMKVLGKSPSEVLEHLSGIAGHSQGCIIAAAIAASDSWDSFLSLSQDALGILFWIGARSQEAYAGISYPTRIVDDSVAHDEGVPSPMLSIRGMKDSEVQLHIDAVNSNLPPSRIIGISLRNGPRSFVVTGPALSLYGLNVRLRQVKASPEAVQTRVPYSQRKLYVINRFLPVSAPFHSNYLAPAIEKLSEDLKDISISSHDLRIPLYDNTTGQDIRSWSLENIIPALVRSVTVSPVFWEKATAFTGATHILDFGPGAESSIGAVTSSNKDGEGVHTILASTFSTASKAYGYKAELFRLEKPSNVVLESWAKRFGPKLLRAASEIFYIDTKMSRFFKLPPIMVAGMTPTTVHWDFVSAIMNAGYHVELACGGYSSDVSLSAAIKNLASSIQPGRGIALNVVFANARSIAWQIPLIRKLRLDGMPIDGLTIGGGVPSLDVAQEYIDTLGLKYISFKPGSSSAIDSVITIARANPNFVIILQWTGGRAGGHHSFEDFYDPILKAYSRIRTCDNIILIAGSGLGGFEDAFPYLNGNWSRSLGYPNMPFDGVLFGSRMMTAKEAHTSWEAKQAIVETEGLGDSDWEMTYRGVAGGILTVKSEWGEPIHMLATRAVRFWWEMDKIFELPKSLQLTELRKRKDYIISKLNSDYSKVWFGKNMLGDVVELWEMTYWEIIHRMIDLMFVKSEGRWIDSSLSVLTEEFIKRTEERLLANDSAIPALDKQTILYNPHETLMTLKKEIPTVTEHLVTADDALYFLYLCQRSGQKPVPFIPVLDENFETWFKKDSLWQSEDIAAVVGQDVQRTCILQGPMAAMYSKTSDEPVGDILDNINNGFIASLSKDLYRNIKVKIPYVEYLGDVIPDASVGALGNSVRVTQNSRSMTLSLPRLEDNEVLPSSSAWLKVLAGPNYSWRHALFSSKLIFSGSKSWRNPIRGICEPTPGLSVTFKNHHKSSKMAIIIENPTQNTCSVVVTSKDLHKLDLRWILPGYITPSQLPEELNMSLAYHPEAPLALLQVNFAKYTADVFDLYRRLWLGGEQINIDDATSQEFDGGEVRITEEAILSFANACGYDSEAYKHKLPEDLQAPLHFGIVVAWKALTKPLFLQRTGGNLLKLVHLSNSFKLAPSAKPLKVGENVSSSSKITAVLIRESGKVIRIRATICKGEQPVMFIESEFLFRGVFTDFENTFERITEEPTIVHLKTEKDVAILLSKPWFSLTLHDASLLDNKVKVYVDTDMKHINKDLVNNLVVTGKVTMETIHGEMLVGSIHHKCEASRGNPVKHYLKKYGSPLETQHNLKNPIALHGKQPRFLRRKVSSTSYAMISGDFNPIHLSNMFATLADLPNTIVHGMQSSALVGSMLESLVHGEVRYFSSSFLNMVSPGDDIQIEAWLDGMIDGDWVISMQARECASSNLVLKLNAVITRPSPAYVFTGQGSQKPMMGMDLYESSSVARSVWDSADTYFSESYGFKISKIVRENPKVLTIYFGGAYGQRIRQNYIDMTMEELGGNGEKVCERLFPSIEHDTQSFTFRSPNGLLFSTQFSQPAITLMQLARFKDMASRGLVPKNSYFAGHSLGEFASITALGQVMTIQQLVEILWFRGTAMQVAVDRDETGASRYSMAAINPSRISNFLDERRLSAIISCISQETGMLLEIVNYNISNRQYVCAGELRAIDCLTQVLKKLQSRDQDSLFTLDSKENDSELSIMIRSLAQKSLQKPPIIELERVTGIVPLPGIDVPFHSTYLRSGISSFRDLLACKIRKENLNPELLVGKWIPNIIGKPFSIEKDYIELIFKITGSSSLRQLLENWQ